MTPVATQVASRVVTLLSGNTDAGARVTVDRVYAAETLPSIEVNTPQFVADPDYSTAESMGAQIGLELIIRAESLTGLESALRNIEAASTALLLADPSLAIGCVDTQFVSSTIERDAEHEKPMGTCTATYVVVVQTGYSDHETIT